MSLANIRQKIDDALATIDGLNHSIHVPSVLTPPFAFPSLRPDNPVEYDLTAQNGALIYHFYIELLVNKGATMEQAQDDIDPYLRNTGDQSIRAGLETVDWGTDADCHRLTGVINYGAATYGGVEYLGARLGLDIWVTT